MSHPGAIVFYISGHGFGHASRVIEVINAVGTAAPGIPLLVRTSAARWLFEATLTVPAEYVPAHTDTGVIQRDSLHMDVDATVQAARTFYASMDTRAREEAAFLRSRHARLVVADLPPLAFAAAREAGVPAIALGNFTWDWIYDAYEPMHVHAPDVIPAIRRAYASAALALRLPMWGGFDGWTCPIEDLPFVARRSARKPDALRDELGIARETRMLLASFGGLGIADLDLARLRDLRDCTVVTTGHGLGYDGPVPPNVRLLDDLALRQAGIRYEDLVRAADIVLTKPGYGIIAECVANQTAMLYTSRGHFVEYDVLVAAMPEVLRCQFVSHDDLFAGRWREHIEAVLAQAVPPAQPRVDGAEVAAGRILRFA